MNALPGVEDEAMAFNEIPARPQRDEVILPGVPGERSKRQRHQGRQENQVPQGAREGLHTRKSGRGRGAGQIFYANPAGGERRTGPGVAGVAGD